MEHVGWDPAPRKERRKSTASPMKLVGRVTESPIPRPSPSTPNYSISLLSSIPLCFLSLSPGSRVLTLSQSLSGRRRWIYFPQQRLHPTEWKNLARREQYRRKSNRKMEKMTGSASSYRVRREEARKSGESEGRRRSGNARKGRQLKGDRQETQERWNEEVTGRGREREGKGRERKERCIPGRVNPWSLEWLTIPWIRAFCLPPCSSWLCAFPYVRAPVIGRVSVCSMALHIIAWNRFVDS